MKRGGRFFEEFSNNDVSEKAGGKERSVKMIERRDEKLFHRYYYHSRIRHLKYDLVLVALGNDFDLSESRLIQIIEANTKRIKEIGDKKLTRQKLKTLYPSFSWNDRPEVVEAVKVKEVYNRY